MADDDKKKGPKIKVTKRDPKRLIKEDETSDFNNKKYQLLIKQYSESREVFDRYSEIKDPMERFIRISMDLDELKKKHVEEAEKFEEEDLKEQLLRLHADFDNFKRRTQEERAELFDTARAEMALKLMPVIDNFDRAAEHVPEPIQKDPWYAGVEGIRKQFNELLNELGIERIKSVGEPFDPNRHEAISHEPSGEHDKDTISEEFEAGYALGDSVIRPAKVNVSSGEEGK